MNSLQMPFELRLSPKNAGNKIGSHSAMQCTDHITHYRLDAELFDYFDEGTGATKDFDRRLRDYVLSLCDAKPGYRVLDIGSGSGWVARRLLAKGAKVVSVDLSLKNLREIKPALDQPSGDSVLADAYHLPFRESLFDVVVISEVLEHLNLPAVGVQEFVRILAPKGKVVATTPYREKIQYYLCIHCNKKTPANAHLHSFDEYSLGSLFRFQSLGTVYLRRFGNKFLLFARVYYLLRFLPFGIWRILDRIANLIIPKPLHIAAVAERD
jgi:ubiquinone/menaquinone biosynthesis C-methylase UbiE